MNKLKNVFFIAMIAVAMIACKSDKETVDTTTTTQTETTTEGMDIAISDASYVWYQGSKVIGGGKHNGKIQFKEGNFVVNNSQVVGGEFIIDMNSITNADIQKEEMEAKFLGHIKSDDFFSVETYPTAKFKILEVSEANAEGVHTVDGTLTIKGTAKNITFPATFTVDGENVTMNAEFTIDRTDFNVNYGSPTKFTDLAKDKAIANKVELKVMATS